MASDLTSKETTTDPDRRQFLSDIKEVADPETYKAVQKKISATAMGNLNRFKIDFEGY